MGWWRRGRLIALGLVVVLQAVLVLGVAAPRLSPRLRGKEYKLRVAPVDPIDPLRGAYVDLAYPQVVAYAEGKDDDEVYIPLRRAGATWRGPRSTSRRPRKGPYIACRKSATSLNCGMHSLFVSQGRARRLGRSLVDGGVATVRIDGRGRAAVVDVEG